MALEGRKERKHGLFWGTVQSIVAIADHNNTTVTIDGIYTDSGTWGKTANNSTATRACVSGPANFGL
jgi:hypothetical protein